MIAHWKGIIEDIHFGGSNKGTYIYLPIFPKKHRLGPQNDFGSEKLLKLVNYQNFHKIVLIQLEKVGGHQYPPISPIYPLHEYLEIKMMMVQWIPSPL
jgi:hypothetical protein